MGLNMGNLYPLHWFAAAAGLILTLSGCSTVPLSTHDNNAKHQAHNHATVPQALPNRVYTPPTRQYAQRQQSHSDNYTQTIAINYQRPAASAPAYQPSKRQPYVTPQRHALLTAAHRSMGVPYRYGGTSPKSGFDCSGFTQHSYQSVNVKIPRTAAQQSVASRSIRRQDLRPGDMIFFKTSGRKVNHVGIYVGNGKFIHAASGGGRVTTDDLRKNYWQKRLHKYGRILS